MKQLVRADFWQGLPETIRHLGGSPEAVLSAAHISAEDLLDSDAYLKMASLLDALEIAARRMERPDLGLIWGDRYASKNERALRLAIVNAPTAREGLQVGRDYMHIYFPSFSGDVTPSPDADIDLVTVTFDLPDRPGAHIFHEFIAATLNRRMIEMCGEDYRAAGILFLHAPISPIEAYMETFRILPRFESGSTGLAIERRWLDAERTGRSEDVYALALKLLSKESPPRDMPITATVAGLVNNMIQSGDCSAAEAAKTLCLHERTLQRRLREEGTSFEQIKDDARRRYALSELERGQASILDIALSLGYSGTSPFTRACRRWFGKPPTQLRGT